MINRESMVMKTLNGDEKIMTFKKAPNGLGDGHALKDSKKLVIGMECPTAMQIRKKKRAIEFLENSSDPGNMTIEDREKFYDKINLMKKELRELI